MFEPDQYELLDFGDGYRLERFGQYVLRRYCPAAQFTPSAGGKIWDQLDFRFVLADGSGEERGIWEGFHPNRQKPDRWNIKHDRITFELKLTEFGHLGIFPEQAENWDWLADRLKNYPGCQILNLFAYTGGSTLAAAAAGAQVVHIDSARNTVAWARHNAELSGLAEAPVRWIAEDALKFVKREVKRKSRYDGIILDPPSFGHGPQGQVWRLSKDLPQLLEQCVELIQPDKNDRDHPPFILLTCHTPKFESEVLAEMLRGIIGDAGNIEARTLMLSTSRGRKLPAGEMVRWTA